MLKMNMRTEPLDMQVWAGTYSATSHWGAYSF